MPINSAQPARIIANIWQEALAVATIHPEDDFFDLGGNSRLAIEIVSRVRDAFDVEVPVAILSTASVFGEFVNIVESSINALERNRKEQNG
jgi:acyl carrier protein